MNVNGQLGYFVNLHVLYPGAHTYFVFVAAPTIDSLRDSCLHLTKKYMIRKESLQFFYRDNLITDDWLQNNNNQTPFELPVHSIHLEVLNLAEQVLKFQRYEEWVKVNRYRLADGQITLGHFIDKRLKIGIDNQPIDLCLFAPELRTEENLYLVALQWKVLTDGEDDVFGWRNEVVVDQNNIEQPKYTVIKDITVLETSLEPNFLTLIHGETQIGKGVDIKVLNWLLPRLGYTVIFMSRKKNGESTINETRKFFEQMKELGTEIYRITYNRYPDNATSRFLSSTVLDQHMKDDKKKYNHSCEAGRWEEGIIVAGMQTYAYILGLPVALVRLMTYGMYKRAVIADEDDEGISTYDGTGSKTENDGKIKTMLDILDKNSGEAGVPHSRQHYNHLQNLIVAYNAVDEYAKQFDSYADLRDTLATKGFDKSIRASADINIVITSTGVSCLHNSYETDRKLNVLMKPIRDNYHGYGVGSEENQIQWVSVSDFTRHDTTLSNREINTIMSSVSRSTDNHHTKHKRDAMAKELKKEVRARGGLPLSRRFINTVRTFFGHPTFNNEPAFTRDARVEVVVRKLRQLRTQHVNARDPYKKNEEQINTIMTEAIADYNTPEAPHVNILLAAGDFREMKAMENVCHQTIHDHGSNGLPAIGFVYNSDKMCNIYFSTAQNSAFRDINIIDLKERIEENFAGVLSRNGTKYRTDKDVVTLSVNLLNNKYRSTHLYYDIVNYIRNIFNVEKPFFICVSGSMAERQAIFKDSQHRYFLTHMLVSFCAKDGKFLDKTLVIQKIGRICGLDNSNYRRKLYCDNTTWAAINKALNLYRRYIRFFSQHRGLTAVEILKHAENDPEVMAVFKEMEEQGNFHRARYSKQMNIEVPALLQPEYRQQVAVYQQPDLTLPAYYQPPQPLQQQPEEQQQQPDVEEQPQRVPTLLIPSIKTTQSAAVWWLLVRYQGVSFTARSMLEYLRQDGYFSTNMQEAPRRNYVFYTSEDADAEYLHRIGRAAIKLREKVMYIQQENRGDVEFSYVGPNVDIALIQ